MSPNELSSDAKAVIKLIDSKAPFIFLTGKAGTGKTTLLNDVYEHFVGRAVKLAPTGVSAINLGGETIHKFFRFPPRMFDTREVGVRRKNPVVGQLKLIIIDEISMVRADLIDNINEVLIKWTGVNEPFGGIQILVVGDLFQLPPVLAPGSEETIFKSRYKSMWFFNANIFRDLEIIGINLTDNFRQQDKRFIQVLDDCRMGRSVDDTCDWLNGRCLKDPFEIPETLTLTATNKAADLYNLRRFEALRTTEVVYEGRVEGDFDIAERRFPAPKILRLKVGAQVMITRNLPEAMNGSLCRVINLDEREIEVEKLDDGNIFGVKKVKWKQVEYSLNPSEFSIEAIASGHFKQFPLALGWAITIHKSQGLTLSSILLDLGSGAFASGQAYVGLSRCRNVNNIALARPMQPKDIIVDEEVLRFTSKLFA